jgi:hypothetical protein
MSRRDMFFSSSTFWIIAAIVAWIVISFIIGGAPEGVETCVDEWRARGC